MLFKRQMICRALLLPLVLTVMSLLVVAMPASSAEWKPTKAIRLVITDNPGNPYDGQARIVANELSKIFNQPVVPENLGGGGMMRGTVAIYNAKPDGYTIGFTSSLAMIINELFQEAKYDLTKFTYLGHTYNLALLPPAAATTAKKGMDTWEDVLKLNRPFRWATVGKGTVTYVAARGLSHAFKLKDPVFVTTYSGAEVVPAVVRGECDGVVMTLDMEEPFIKTGELKLVLAPGKKRYQKYPDVPCAGDLGHPEVEQTVTNYHIVIAPPGLPKDIGNVLSEAVYKAITSEGMKEYQKKALLGGINYEPTAAEESRAKVFGCLETIKGMAPFIK